MKESGLGTDPIGQNLIKSIGNFCFSSFVFSVLIFTVIAITYQPPAPWLESAPALTRLFIETRKATFRNDNSVLYTWEDLASTPGIVLFATSPVASAIPITESSIESAEQRIGNSTGKDGLVCDEMADGRVNCSDPHVCISVEKFNPRTFKSIVFFEYQTPVAGSMPDECDVAWRFRNKKGEVLE